MVRGYPKGYKAPAYELKTLADLTPYLIPEQERLIKKYSRGWSPEMRALQEAVLHELAKLSAVEEEGCALPLWLSVKRKRGNGPYESYLGWGG